MVLFCRLVVVCLTGLLMACAGGPKLKKFDTTQRVQTIEINRSHSIYAQDDTLLEDDDIDQRLAKMNKSWRSDLETVSRNETIGQIGFILQLVGLAGCLAGGSAGNLAAWCLGGIGAGLAISLPFAESASSGRREVVDKYNEYLLQSL